MAGDTQYDVVVIGTYFYDQIYVGLPQFPQPGREVFCQDLVVTPGASYITVAALTLLGAKVGWISCFGNDYYSRYSYDCGQREGIDLSLARCLNRPYRQVTTSLPFDGERAFVTVSDPDPDDMAAHSVATLSKTHFKHLHFAALPDKTYLPVIELARKQGASVSADCQDVPIVETPGIAYWMIEQLDVFLPNAREVRALSETVAVRNGICQVAQRVNTLVVKDGANGAWFAEGGSIDHVPPIPVEAVIDTTGAGDCFNAGFLFGRVVERCSTRRSVAYGNICAGHSVMGIGGTARLLDREELHHVFMHVYGKESGGE